MRGMRVICSRFNEQTRQIEVVREITNDDGSIEYNGLSMTTDKLESLSALYEIDDLDELVELVIYESFMEPVDIGTSSANIRQRRRGHLAETKTRLGPVRPSNGKPNLKNRLRDAGFPDHYINAVDDDCMEVIKRHSIINEESKQRRKDQIQARREGKNTSQLLPRSPIKESSRLPGRIKAPEVKTLETVELIGGKRARKDHGQKSV